MRKPSGCGCGCLSFITGLGLLFLVIALPSMVTESSLINQTMGAIFCGDSDAYINESYTASARGGSGIRWVLDAQCRRPDNRVEDITSAQETTGFALFLGCLIVGFIAFMVIPTDVTASKAKLAEYADKTSTHEQNLAERLRQLDESYQAGLITQDEYDDTRKRLLENL